MSEFKAAPEKLVRDVIDLLQDSYSDLMVEDLPGDPENMVFALPKELRLVQK